MNDADCASQSLRNAGDSRSGVGSSLSFPISSRTPGDSVSGGRPGTSPGETVTRRRADGASRSGAAPGNASAQASVPTTQRIPPETTEKRRLVSDATMPASRLPSAGVLATCANSIPPSRPRISSGVTVSTIVERNTALTWSAAPATASSTQRDPERRREAERGDGDSPARRGEDDGESLAAHAHHPAGDERRGERADRRRREEIADRCGVLEDVLRERREQRGRHAEDHRDRVDEEEAEHDVLRADVAEALPDRREGHALRVGRGRNRRDPEHDHHGRRRARRTRRRTSRSARSSRSARRRSRGRRRGRGCCTGR